MAATSFKFDKKTSQILNDLKDRTGAASKAEVLRKAIALLDAVSEENLVNKKKLILEAADGEKQELIIT